MIGLLLAKINRKSNGGLELLECVVVGCAQEAVAIAGKPTPWGAWEYWVCAAHKAEVDAGATIEDQPDGRSIALSVDVEVRGRS